MAHYSPTPGVDPPQEKLWSTIAMPEKAGNFADALKAPEAILRRRATRHFDPARPVPDELLRQVLNLATHAPSSFNLQPWRFLVVRSQKNREKLKACAFGQPKIAEAPVVVVVLGYVNPHQTHMEPMIKKQVDLGAVDHAIGQTIKGMAAATMERRIDPGLWATRSTMLAAATMMIAAESLGLASAPMEGFEHDKVRAAFGVPDDHVVCCLVALGFQARSQPFPGRLELEEVCFEEHFGQPWTLGNA